MTPFDAYLHAVLMRAMHEAREDGSKTVEAQHLLLAIAGEGESTTREILASAGLDLQAVRDALDREFEHSLSAVGVSSRTYDLPAPSKGPTNPKIGASAKLAMDRAFSSVPRKKDLRPAHMLLGLLRAEVGTVPRALALAGADRTDLLTRAQHAVPPPRN
jgi:D-alanyl-D-alanine carboxypeptidase